MVPAPISLLALGIIGCWGISIENFADLTKLNLSFDFIVVGGGTAGNVIANRLSEDPKYSILVLEAGGSNALDITDWNYTSTPQAAMNGLLIPYPRGFVLGSSSSVNYMAYTRGSKEDFDRFAAVTGDDGWSWNSLIPYMRKNEHFNLSTSDHHNITGQFIPAVPGFSGVNTVSLAGFPSQIDSRIIQTTTKVAEFPFNLDLNSGYHLGIGWGQSTVKNGARSSSATSYSTPQFVSRPNLHVLLHARVTGILQTAPGELRTVEFVQDLNGLRFNLTAKNEIVLFAGSIGTPNILLHSGIGNSSTLKALGIEPLHDLPSVGQNMSDHPLAAVSFLVDSNSTYETAERNATLAAEQLVQWNTTRTGPLVDVPSSHLGWLRIQNSSIFDRFPDPAAGPNTAHYELIIKNGMFGPPPPTGHFLGIVPALVSPTARGSVTLKSNDVFAAPPINSNLLGSELDLFILPWANYVISPVGLNSTMLGASGAGAGLMGNAADDVGWLEHKRRQLMEVGAHERAASFTCVLSISFNLLLNHRSQLVFHHPVFRPDDQKADGVGHQEMNFNCWPPAAPRLAWPGAK